MATWGTARFRSTRFPCGAEPFLGHWALPGGFLQDDETLDQCAARELAEETGLKRAHLDSFGHFSAPARDPRGRVVTIAYLALVPSADHLIRAGTDAAEARWHPVARLPKLAFDHREIVRAARRSLADRLDREPLALALLPDRFTLPRLQKIYEAITGVPHEKRNFRRFIQARGWIRDTGQLDRSSFRPAAVYERA